MVEEIFHVLSITLKGKFPRANGLKIEWLQDMTLITQDRHQLHKINMLP